MNIDQGSGQRLDAMLDAYREMRGKLDETAASIRSKTVTVESRDGLVRVTVGSSGELQDLWIDPKRHRRVDSITLAETIKDVVGTARQQFNEQVAGRYQEVLGSSFDIGQLLGGDEGAAAEQIRSTSRHLFGS